MKENKALRNMSQNHEFTRTDHRMSRILMIITHGLVAMNIYCLKASNPLNITRDFDPIIRTVSRGAVASMVEEVASFLELQMKYSSFNTLIKYSIDSLSALN